MNKMSKPALKKIGILPVVKHAQLQLRHLAVAISFLVWVLLPAAATGWYLWTKAADQYSTTLGFTVRSDDTAPSANLLTGLTALSGGAGNGSDASVLYEYINSQNMVAALDAEMDLVALFQGPEEDPIFTLSEDPSIEDLHDYWRKMVRVNYDSSTLLIDVQVRAFTPADAQNIALAIYDHSKSLIDNLSSKARSEAIKFAEETLARSEQRLTEARRELSLYQQATNIIDPTSAVRAQTGMLTHLNEKLVDTLIQQDLLSPTDPRVEQLENRRKVIEARIEQEQFKIFNQGDADNNLTKVIERYSDLATNLEFAEKSYVASLAQLDAARASAERLNRYLAIYAQPTLAESASYPQKYLILALVFIFAFLSWSVMVLVGYSIKDRR